MEIIYNLQELEGTCYLEILPGKYMNKCWNKESIFFDEEVFLYFEPIIAKAFDKYDHYSFQAINKDIWSEIIGYFKDVEEILKNNINDLDKYISPYFKNSTSVFSKKYKENTRELIGIMNEFTGWILKTLEDHDEISILGI